MTCLFEKGREAFGKAGINWTTDTIRAALIDTGTASTAVKAITGATNATPIVVTATAHGYTNGDIIYIDGVGGNLAANGLWQISGVAANTFNLLNPVTAGNSVGSAAYTSGGAAVCVGPSASGDNLDDISASIVGSAVTLTSPTMVQGVADSADVTFTAVTGASAEAFIIYKDTGTPSTSTLILWNAGKFIVTADATAAISATTIVTEALPAGIPNGTVLTFSNGATATLSALANAGDRALTVSALAAAVASGSRALAPVTGAGLPVTPNGGNINLVFDNTANKIFKL